MPGAPRFTLRTRLRDPSVRMLGTFILVPRVEIVEAVAGAGFGAVVVDLEHGPYDIGDLTPLVAAARGAGAVALARVAEPSEAAIGRALDTGVDGVIVPHVDSAADAAAAVAAARFPPEGTRSVNPYVRSAGYGLSPSFLGESNEGVAVLVMVEGAQGVSALDEILSVPGLDGVFIGPVDLSAAMGRPGDAEHPDVVAEVSRILRRVGDAGIAPALYAPTAQAARRWSGRGARFVALSADIAMAVEAFARYVEEVAVES